MGRDPRAGPWRVPTAAAAGVGLGVGHRLTAALPRAVHRRHEVPYLSRCEPRLAMKHPASLRWSSTTTVCTAASDAYIIYVSADNKCLGNNPLLYIVGRNSGLVLEGGHHGS